jgi:chaperonin GroES
MSNLIEPLAEMVALEVEEEKISKGGIHIPDTAKDKPQQGKVVAVGTGKPNDMGVRVPLLVKVGDVVFFSKHAGHEVEVKGKKFLLVHDDNLLARLPK